MTSEDEHPNADDVLYPRLTPEEITARFKRTMDELQETPSELARRMHELGDHRSVDTILRGIQRMVAGDVGVSGEMQALAMVLVRQQRLRARRYAGVKWQTMPNGVVSASVDDFTITLHPESRGRWHVNLAHHKSGFSPKWPAWQPNLEAAKQKALTCLNDAHNDLDEIERDRAAAA